MFFILLTLLPLSIIIVFAVLLRNIDQLFERQATHLLGQSPKQMDKIVTHRNLAHLPEPVQNYFRHVLKEGLPYISCVRLKHSGKFKTSEHGKWMDITGEEYFTTADPGLVWKGHTKWFTAYDVFISGQGKLDVYFLSMFRIVNGHGLKYSQAELLRWLGESVWFPTNLLPTEFLQWSAIDSHSAKLTYTSNKFIVYYIVTFNDIGEITQLETKRYMGDKNLETWIGKLSGYASFHGVLIPTKIEAVWRMRDRDFPYAQFQITELEYDKNQLF
ncbi:DUF6544 family protein [Flavobacterium sp.]|uniref:DUF6544 family protein n=1 Tax=Flavobacterium sp. TaxID=239 RepID=UPI0039E2637F